MEIATSLQKVLFLLKTGEKMANSPVDRNRDYMREMWGTSKLITDYDSNEDMKPKRVIQEIMHDIAPKHNLKTQTDLHEKIRNDEDYDDWDYGTEPNYGYSWKS